eukprot:Gb_12862 [translate_table: standard]
MPSCSVAFPPQLQTARAVFISTVANWPAISHEHHTTLAMRTTDTIASRVEIQPRLPPLFRVSLALPHNLNGTTKETLRLDIIERSASKCRDANIVVFNTGHWWTHEKTSKGKDYYQEGDHVYSELNLIEAYRKALRTWAKWVDRNINSKKIQVFFQGYSASHFSGGQWRTGRQCHIESQPIFNESYMISTYLPKMNVLESVLKEMKTPVVCLNITRMTNYRKEGHPYVYRKKYLSQEERMASDIY